MSASSPASRGRSWAASAALLLPSWASASAPEARNAAASQLHTHRLLWYTDRCRRSGRRRRLAMQVLLVMPCRLPVLLASLALLLAAARTARGAPRVSAAASAGAAFAAAARSVDAGGSLTVTGEATRRGLLAA